MPKFAPNDFRNEEKKRSIDLETIILQLLRNWWIILIGTLIAGMFIFIFVTETYKEKYASSATFVVTGKGSVSSTMLSDIETAKSMTEAFGYVLDSDIMMEKVKEAVGIRSFNGSVHTEQVPETNILSLTVTADTPQLAFSVINAIIDNHHLVTDSMMQNASMNVLMQPTMPKSAVSPLNRRNRVITYSLFAMIAIAGLIVAATVFSPKIYKEQDFEDKVGGYEKLAALEHESSRRRKKKSLFARRTGSREVSLLVTNPATSFGYTETFRLLKTKLQQLMEKSGMKVLMVSSVDADEGRSTVAANLALTFARDSKRVLLIEADTGEPSLAKLLEIKDGVQISIDEYILGDRGGERLPVLDYCRNLSVLLCRERVQDQLELLSSVRMQSFMDEARKFFDYIVIDTPPIASSNAAEYCAELSDAVVMVIRQGFASSSRISTALTTLSANTAVLGYILNDVHTLPFFGSASETAASSTGYGKLRRGAYGNYGAYGGYGGRGAYGGYTEVPEFEEKPAEARENGEGIHERPLPSRAAAEAEAAAEDESVIDLWQLVKGSFRTFIRIIWLPLALAVLLSGILCYYSKAAYKPRYKASATFTIGVTGASGSSAAEFSRTATKRLSKIFPHVLMSGILNNLICDDLNVKTVPAKLSAHGEGETTLFTLEATADDPENALAVLESAIRKYPQISDFVIGNTRMTLLSEPKLPEKPVNRVDYKRMILIGSTVAFLIGIGAAVIINLTRRTVGGTEEIRDILNIRCIGTLPYEKPAKNASGSGLVTIASGSTSKDFADSVSLICRRIEKSAAEHGDRTILFAGSIPGEGKSTAVLNSALALAANGNTVILIDCDIRKPSSIGELPGIREKGLVEYLRGEAEINEIVSRIGENIYAIRGSTKNYNAPELFRSSRMHTLVESVKQNADFVIFDAPPSAILADSQLIAEYADCVVYVVCQDYTIRNSLIEGVNNLANTGVRFMGYVLNNAGSSETGHSYSSKHKYARYGKYGGYGRYGGYGKYGRYGGYGKYGKYGGYGKYGKYGKYGAYGADKSESDNER